MTPEQYISLGLEAEAKKCEELIRTLTMHYQAFYGCERCAKEIRQIDPADILKQHAESELTQAEQQRRCRVKQKNYRASIYEQSAFPPSVFRIRIIAPNGRVFNHSYNSRSGARRSLDHFLEAVREGRVVIERSSEES